MISVAILLCSIFRRGFQHAARLNVRHDSFRWEMFRHSWLSKTLDECSKLIHGDNDIFAFAELFFVSSSLLASRLVKLLLE